ncbi:hypothetical protein N4G41_03800 [Kosakonia sacchari]|uniref:hypothetical protein n=1 Tax=Kosakonia sacchari TaxID=1158459 RepID=UPI002ACEE065|nr:hypothetical protein [Kosakonia sacchari]MDZ7320753.1 hypothetical protein [Kosakonia sacchari]
MKDHILRRILTLAATRYGFEPLFGAISSAHAELLTVAGSEEEVLKHLDWLQDKGLLTTANEKTSHPGQMQTYIYLTELGAKISALIEA